MPVTAKFLADYSDFSKGTKDAEKDLLKFQTTAERSMDVVAKGMSEAGRAARELKPAVEGVSTEFSDFDSLLRSFGVNIGTQNKALEELGRMAGLSAGNLALLGKAVGIVGAAMAGWEIGRKIAEFTGSDKIIGDATAKLLGWGSTSEQVAGMQQDTINKAIRDGAAATITFTEALAFNTKQAKENQVEAVAAGKAHDEWAKATAYLDTVAGNWQTTLGTINGTTVEAIKYYLDAGVAQGTLATAFGVTDLQIKAVEQSLKAETAAQKEAQRAAEEATKAIQAGWESVGSVLEDVLGTPQLKKAKDWQDAIAALGGDISMLSNTQLVELRDAMLAAVDVMARTGQLTSEQSSRFAELALAADQATAATRAHVVAVDDLADSLYKEAVALDAEYAALRAVNTEKAAATAATAAQNTLKFTPVPGSPTGRGGALSGIGGATRVEDLPAAYRGIVNEYRHKQPKGLSVYGGPGHVMGPTHAPVMTNYVNVNGIMMSDNPAAKDALAQAIIAAMTQNLSRSGMQLGTA